VIPPGPSNLALKRLFEECKSPEFTIFYRFSFFGRLIRGDTFMQRRENFFLSPLGRNLTDFPSPLWGEG
jgi:hypothetical protein